MRQFNLWVLVLGLRGSYPTTRAAKTWVTLPIRQPPLNDTQTRSIPQIDGSLGSPPQNITMILDVGHSNLFAIIPECLLCPMDGIYDPQYSSSAKVDVNQPIEYSLMSGNNGTETLTLGGVLQAINSPLAFIDVMSLKEGVRFSGGLFVPQLNYTQRAQSSLLRLDNQSQLLNPVWGLRLGGENPQLTIGALDPNDYHGDINWVPATGDLPAISVDALKGYQGNVVPADYPISVGLNSLSKNIYLPQIDVFTKNKSLIGPQERTEYAMDDPRFYTILCNGTEVSTIDFSVEINGVDYPMAQQELVRQWSSQPGFCQVGISGTRDGTYTLGLTFMKSVYLAYRFPTGTCPGYWGFAIPKGTNLTTPTNQKPKSTPTDASTCLSFATPTSTPIPIVQPSEERILTGSNGKKYAVYRRPNDASVDLRGVADLPQLKAAGAIFGFGA